MNNKPIREETKRKISEALRGSRHPLYGKHHSREAKEKISESVRRLWTDNNYKDRMKFSHEGHKHSEEHKRKISEANKGRKMPLEAVIKSANARKGIKYSEEIKSRMAERSKRLWKSDEYRNKTIKARTGEKNSTWRGGITEEKYGSNWTEDLKESIRKKHEYVCQLCGIHQDELEGWNKKLDIHHINYDKDDLNPNNLISLCRSCHARTNIGREYWINYFYGVDGLPLG